MDEHSQEYIAFMQKAKGLQALWVPAVGDFLWCNESGFYGLWLVVPRSDDNAPFGLAGLDHSGYFGVFGELDELRPFAQGIAVWLPSLHQLLRVIEGAGWEWRRLAGKFRGWPRNSTIQGPIGFDDKDLMLGFAQLAARAVEAQHEPTG